MKLCSSVILFLACAAPAQCLFTSVTTDSVGPPCNAASTGFCAVVAMPAWLTSALDVANCRLQVDVNAFEGCGATVPVRVLAIGFAPAAVPLPDLGIDCMLHVLPIAFLASASPTFLLDLPPAVPTFAFYMQGAALSIPPFATEGWFTLSAGQLVSLQ